MLLRLTASWRKATRSGGSRGLASRVRLCLYTPRMLGRYARGCKPESIARELQSYRRKHGRNVLARCPSREKAETAIQSTIVRFYALAASRDRADETCHQQGKRHGKPDAFQVYASGPKRAKYALFLRKDYRWVRDACMFTG